MLQRFKVKVGVSDHTIEKLSYGCSRIRAALSKSILFFRVQWEYLTPAFQQNLTSLKNGEAVRSVEKSLEN